MIEINSRTSASDFIRQRAARMWVRTQHTGDTIIARVTPHGAEFGHQSKHKRIVEINLKDRTAQCLSIDGEECPANAWGQLCSHVFRALQQIAKNQGRRRVQN